MGELLERRRAQGVFGEEVFGEAVGRVGRAHDGVLVGGGFLRFLFGGGTGGGRGFMGRVRKGGGGGGVGEGSRGERYT